MFATRKLVHLSVSLIVVVSMLVSAVYVPAVSAQGQDGLKREQNAQTGRVSFIGPEAGSALPAAQALGESLSRGRPEDPALALARRFAPEFGLQNPNQDLQELRKQADEN